MSRFSKPTTPRALTPEDLRHITRCLQQRVLSQQILIGVMALFGIPLLAVGPLIFGTIAWLMGEGGHSWAWYFWIAAVISLPIFFWLEHRTQGKFAEEAAVGYTEGAAGIVDRIMGKAGGKLIVVVIFSLLGPGMILGAVRRWRGQLLHRAAPIDRCAEVTGDLFLVDGGVDIFTLQRPGEKFEDLLTVIEYLVHYDWAGTGDNGQRVWLSSHNRKRLSGMSEAA